MLCISFVLSSFTPNNDIPKISKNNGSCKVKLLRIHCTAREDFTGCDDIYFIINGEKTQEWKGCRGATIELNKTFYFDGSTSISLYDYDVDGDDCLGTKKIYCAEAQEDGEQTKNFNEDGADYTLYYKVFYN